MWPFHFQLSYLCPHIIIRACAELYPNFDLSCTSPQLLYVPAMSKYYLIFCCSPEYLCVLSFLDICTFCCSLFLSLSYSTPVIWLIVFTAVNFHLVFFFFSFQLLHLTLALPPAIGCCLVVLGRGGRCVILEPFLHCFPIAPPPLLCGLIRPSNLLPPRRSCWFLVLIQKCPFFKCLHTLTCIAPYNAPPPPSMALLPPPLLHYHTLKSAGG